MAFLEPNPAPVDISEPGRRLRLRLYLLSFIDEFGPVYAVFTLLFNDNGISTAQVSWVFVTWGVVAFFLEVPSGMLADQVDRRRLLAAAFGLKAGGLVVWLLWPTFTGALVGAVLWAVHDALASGAWEAMIYDQLAATGNASVYERVMARSSQFSHLGVATSTVLGAGLLGLGVGLAPLGWITVGAVGITILLVLLLPGTRTASFDDGKPADGRDSEPDESTSVGQSLGSVLAGPEIRRLLILGAMLEGLFLIDEYLPLLTRVRGGSDAAAPVIYLTVWLGLLAGGELVVRRPGLSGKVMGSAIVASMAVAGLALISRAVWPLALVAAGYAFLEAARIANDARLQERTPDAVRATVSSVRGFASALISTVMLALIGVMSDGDDPTPGLFVLAGALAATGVLLVRWLPTTKPTGPQVDATG